jgi:CHAT domain-containing protein
LATHGFYDDTIVAWAHHDLKARSAVLPAAGQRGSASPAPSTVVRPDLSVGLALAGANEPNAPDEDDGILWAMEIAAMDLGNVDMVVMSACQSAQGQLHRGEAALSLQRAFQIAGTRTVVSTLWPVDDQAARLLMERFYSNLLGSNSSGTPMTKLEALREAQLWMLSAARKSLTDGQQPAESLTYQATYLPPTYLFPAIWAPFILNGDWR